YSSATSKALLRQRARTAPARGWLFVRAGARIFSAIEIPSEPSEFFVMAGLVPAIRVFPFLYQGVDARYETWHDTQRDRSLGVPIVCCVSAVIAQTSASTRSGERPAERPSGPKPAI